MSAPAYRPNPGSLPGRVIAFFVANADEELTLDDITSKYEAVRNSIHTLLKPAVDAGFLTRGKNGDGEYIYSAGKKATSAYMGDAPAATLAFPWGGTAVKAKEPGIARPHKKINVAALNIDAIKVSDDIPIPLTYTRGANKWDTLFAKLKKPGQSLPIPAEVHGALTAEAKKRKNNKRGVFRVARTSATESRIWRIE